MERLPNIHPGEVLREEFLTPLGITNYKLSKKLGVSLMRLQRIIDGRRAITEDIAYCLGSCFQTTPQFWLNLQAAFDLEAQETGKHSNPYKRIRAHHTITAPSN